MSVSDEGLKLSVLLVTYNHERCVHRALETLFKQDYIGPVELVVADDASADGTLDLIREFDGKDSRFIFKYLPSNHNIGITRNYKRGFSECSGQYVAVLEGDDYWISPRKIARQIEFLENHWECDLCSVNYFVFDEERAIFSERVAIGAGHRLLSARDLIADNLVGNFSTCMYRKSALDSLPAKLFELNSYDWIVNICVARFSLIGFIEEPMSVYRVHSSGAWSNYKQADRLKLQLSLIPSYDNLTNRQFHAEFTNLEGELRKVSRLSRTSRLPERMIRSISVSMSLIADFTPPIITMIIRTLMPPALTRLLHRVIRKGQIP